MIQDKITEKLKILSDAAKYDVSCSSSGSKRKNASKGLGNSDGIGICHSYTEDGRCVSLLKILLTNYCIFDCAYCISRKSNDVKRVAFTVEEVVDLTINFYRRNFIEGLFLSSGIFKNPDYTMERLVRIAKDLRLKHNFNGYIHLKAIPGASDELISQAALYADRLSVNIELPSEESLKALAPEKDYASVYKPMNFLKKGIEGFKEQKKSIIRTPNFAPAGQSTQLVIGATGESDNQILDLASGLYQQQKLKRVYYSAYVPVSEDNRMLAIKSTPVLRENRLYQADWLLRVYGFKREEIVNDKHQNLDLDIDPKLGYALRNIELFPIDINIADYEMIVRIPGVGIKSAKMIVAARKFNLVKMHHLQKMGVVIKRAKWFIKNELNAFNRLELDPQALKIKIVHHEISKITAQASQQLTIF